VPTHEDWSGHVTAFATSITDKDYEQPRALWKIICKEPKGKEQFLHNILPTLRDIPDKMKDQVIGKFYATVEVLISHLLILYRVFRSC
jgi:catalase